MGIVGERFSDGYEAHPARASELTEVATDVSAQIEPERRSGGLASAICMRYTLCEAS